MRQASEKRLLYLACALAGLLLGALGWPALFGRVYVKDDLGAFSLPIRFFYGRSLALGDDFLWFPGVWSGFFLHGEGQVGMYHPLHLLLYRTLPLSAAFNLESLLSYPFMLAGSFLFLRRWQIPASAAMFGALVFAFSGFNLLHFVHINMVSVVAHMPWLLLAIDIALREADPRRVACAKLWVALLTTSQLLLGYPHMVWLSSFAEILYVLFRTPAWHSRRRLLSLGEAKLIGILGGSIQLLPTWDTLSHSVRAAPSVDYLYSFSLHPLNLLQLVAPYLFAARAIGGNTHESGLYVGALAPVLLLWLALRARSLGPMRALVVGATALAVLTLSLALGQYGGLYTIQVHLPLINVFRVPARYILLVHFAIAILSAIAFADLCGLARRTDRGPASARWPLALLPIMSAGVALFFLWARTLPPSISWTLSLVTAQLGPTLHVLAGPVLVTLATGLVVAASRGVPYTLGGLIVFAVLDQGAYGLSYLVPPWPTDIASFVDSQPAPSDALHQRLQSSNTALTMKDLRLAGGYVALVPKRQLAAMSTGHLRAAGVGWVDASQSTAAAFPDPRTARWVQVPGPMARVRLVSRAVESHAPGKDIDGVDLETTALVSEPLQLEEGPPGQASISSDRPGRIRIATTTASRQLLVLAESYDDGWRATVDGQNRPVLRVYGDFMGCVVERGEHDVSFRFEPRSVRLGGWLSTVGIALMLASWSISWLPGRARRDRQAD